MSLTNETLKFLRGLERNNTREWFDPRKEDYKRVLRGPMLELAADLNAKLARFAPDFVTDPEKAVFRIYRDTRFSKDKTPYKTHSGLLFWHKIAPKNTGPAFYVHVGTKEVMIAGGLYMPGAAETLMIRQHIADNEKRLRAIVRGKALRDRFGEMQGDSLARAPKGFAPDHPAMDLVKRKQWVFWTEEPPATCLEPKFADSVAAGFKALAPFVSFLNEPFVARAKLTKDPLFATA